MIISANSQYTEATSMIPLSLLIRCGISLGCWRSIIKLALIGFSGAAFHACVPPLGALDVPSLFGVPYSGPQPLTKSVEMRYT